MPIPNCVVATRNQHLIVRYLNEMGLLEGVVRAFAPPHNAGATILRATDATLMVIYNPSADPALSLMQIPLEVADCESACQIFRKTIENAYHPTDMQETEHTLSEVRAARNAAANN